MGKFINSWIRQYLDALKFVYRINGRIQRTQYQNYLFGPILFFMIAIIAVYLLSIPINYILQDTDFDKEIIQVVFTSISFFLFLPFIPSVFFLHSRRLHDLGLSGWWQLTGLIPGFGFVLLLILLFKSGENVDNIYGPS